MNYSKGGEVDRDLCTGDGGSPLSCSVSSNPDHYYQVGVTVGGIGCGLKDIPRLFINVAAYRDWIDQKLSEHEIDTSSFTF